jgi:hypothetical protein
VDVVSARFSSFHGVVDALVTAFSPQKIV